MTIPTTEALLTRFITEYGALVDQINHHAVIENEFDRGWVSAFASVAERFHLMLTEFTIEVSPPPQVIGSRYDPTIRRILQ